LFVFSFWSFRFCLLLQRPVNAAAVGRGGVGEGERAIGRGKTGNALGLVMESPLGLSDAMRNSRNGMKAGNSSIRDSLVLPPRLNWAGDLGSKPKLSFQFQFYPHFNIASIYMICPAAGKLG
jgi:hypothetical protein